MPGRVRLLCRRGEVHVEAIGLKEVGGADPIRRDTISRISSMTKPIILMTQCTAFPLFSGVYLDFWTSAYQAIDD